MARPLKKGLDYFSHDTNLSGSDNIEAIEAVYGNNGYAVYLKLLEKIYANGGKFFISDTETEKRLAEKFHLESPEILIKIINSMAFLELFDKKIWDNAKMLTSSRVKRTLKSVVNHRLRAKKSYSKKVSEAET